MDPTILYYLICHAMPIVKMNNLNDVFSLICEGLLRLGVSYDTLLEESKMEFLKYSDIAVNSEILSISSTAKAGQRNYELNNWSKADLDFTQLSLPPIYLNDFAQVNVFPDKENIFASINLDQLTDDLAEGQSWVEKFVEVCV